MHGAPAAIRLVGRALAFCAGGCQSGPVGFLPAGPGVATKSDLTPWLASAEETTRFGRLMEFNVPGQLGSYDTWGLATPVPLESVEVDVRACPGAAQDFWGKPVIITGKLIAREKRHMPLLVAERIAPADDNGKELPDLTHHVAMAPEKDPVTGMFDPMVEFQTSGDGAAVIAAAN